MTNAKVLLVGAVVLAVTALVVSTLVQAYVIRTDNRLLGALKPLIPGQSLADIESLLQLRFTMVYEVPSDWVEGHRAGTIRYRALHYMGFITSRNLVLYLDADKNLVFATWEHT